MKLLINRFNTITEFLTEIKIFNIILLSKSSFNNEFIKMNTI